MLSLFLDPDLPILIGTSEKSGLGLAKDEAIVDSARPNPKDKEQQPLNRHG